MTNGAWTVPANIVPVDEESPRKGIKILVGAAGRPSATFSTRACPRWQAVISVDTCLGDHGRLEWVALFARQAMVVAGAFMKRRPFIGSSMYASFGANFSR